MQASWIAGICILSVSAFAADPVLGTWRLNLTKSHYNPGPAPRSQVRLYEAKDGGMSVTIKTVTDEGKSTTVRHPLNYDGKEYIVTGSSSSNAIKVERVNEYTAEAILHHASKIIGTNRRTVSTDRKTLTIVYDGTDDRGRKVKNTAVYDRQ